MVPTVPNADFIPQEQPPKPGAEDHLSWLHRAMSTVASALGGDETWKVTKAADGSVSAEKQPSTEKEKWGRIAAAVLGGAARGLAVGQGPGGAARAVAAGSQFGMQLPQQIKENVQQDATAAQKSMQFNANNAILHQKGYQELLNSQALGTAVGKEDADLLDKYDDEVTSSPNAKDYGPVKGWDDLNRIRKDPEFLQHHMNGDLKVMPVRGANGNFELHAVATDSTDDKQPTEAGATRLGISFDTKTGKPSLTKESLAAGANKKGELRLSNQAIGMQYMEALNKWTDTQSKAEKAGQEKVPTTAQQALAMAAQTNDPTEKANYTKLAGDMQKLELQQKAAGRTSISTAPGITPPGTPITEMIKPGARFAPNTVEGTVAQKLASGDTTMDQLPKRMAKGYATPQEYQAAAEAYSQKMYGMPYSPTMIEQEKKFFDNTKAQGVLDGIDKMIGWEGHPGYLDQVVDMAKATGIGQNAPLNEVELAVKNKFGDDAAKNFHTALGEVQRSIPTLIGNPLVGGGDSDIKFKAAQDMFGQNPTMSNLQSTAGVLKNMMHGSLDSYTHNNRFLQRRYGIEQAKAGITPPNAAANNTPPPTGGGGGAGNPQAAVQAPAGATVEYKDAKGNVTGWAVNGKYVAR
jgi:hypothetical protein